MLVSAQAGVNAFARSSFRPGAYATATAPQGSATTRSTSLCNPAGRRGFEASPGGTCSFFCPPSGVCRTHICHLLVHLSPRQLLAQVRCASSRRAVGYGANFCKVAAKLMPGAMLLSRSREHSEPKQAAARRGIYCLYFVFLQSSSNHLQNELFLQCSARGQ